MLAYQREFLQLCIQNQILMFGEFTLKSGRISPYFFNAGKFSNGHLLTELARCYAQLISTQVDGPYMLYGPAYKGIPLAAATAVQLYQHCDVNIPYAFNRKEIKDHGEGGLLVGAALNQDVIIIDDVITAGTSVSESVEIIEQAGAKLKAIVIAVDRQEIADGESMSAVQIVEKRYDVPVLSLLKLDHLIEYIGNSADHREFHDAICDYRAKYGVREIDSHS